MWDSEWPLSCQSIRTKDEEAKRKRRHIKCISNYLDVDLVETKHKGYKKMRDASITQMKKKILHPITYIYIYTLRWHVYVHTSRDARKRSLFLTVCDTNQSVQPREMVRFRKQRNCTISVAKEKQRRQPAPRLLRKLSTSPSSNM